MPRLGKLPTALRPTMSSRLDCRPAAARVRAGSGRGASGSRLVLPSDSGMLLLSRAAKWPAKVNRTLGTCGPGRCQQASRHAAEAERSMLRLQLAAGHQLRQELCAARLRRPSSGRPSVGGVWHWCGFAMIRGARAEAALAHSSAAAAATQVPRALSPRRPLRPARPRGLPAPSAPGSGCRLGQLHRA